MAGKHGTLHMIGNAHIDPVWLWQWQEGFHEVMATFRSMLDRMNEYDDFVFTGSSAAFYEWVERSDPRMMAEIKQRVGEGRWQIVGGWWIQPDCNIPCGESFVRQALYGQRYFKEKLGVTAHVGYNPDSFGHHGMLPQILKKSGLEGYAFMRPQPHEKVLPGRLFWWEADDGSRVLVSQIPYEYCSSGKELDEHIRRCAAEITSPLPGICYYGVGNHGGGPTKANIDSIHRLQGDDSLPALVFSSPQQFLARALDAARANSAAIPVVHDDLQHHAPGCYAAHSGVKRWNRTAENLLMAAEKYATLAAIATGQPYPTDFARAWKNVLFCQFHDILAGTSLETAYDDARAMYGEAMTIAGSALNYAVQSLARTINIPFEQDMRPIVVFNVHAWPVSANVEVEIEQLHEDDALLDDQNRPIPFQTVQSLAVKSDRNRLSFVADLPALGYRLYRVARRPELPASVSMAASDLAMENARLRLSFDGQTGQIASLYDKQLGLEVFMPGAARAVVIDDPSDTWSHAATFERVIGEFTGRSVTLIENGPVKAVIRVESVYGASRLIQDFTMYAAMDVIDVHVTVDWQEQCKMLKLRFPVNLTSATATYEIPYGHIVRPANGEEEPGQSWVDISGTSSVSGEGYGVSILNDGKYSFDVAQAEIGLTVLRSPAYAHHMPAVLDPGKQYSFIDQGLQRFTYTLLPHRAGWQTAGTARRAAELNQPPVALRTTYHDNGTRPQAESFALVEPENIILSVLKQAEDNGDIIVRCYETAKQATQATITLPFCKRAVKTTFGPCEIKTLRIPRDAAQAVTETSLLEWDDEHPA
jgi:alpha-mannosidase